MSVESGADNANGCRNEISKALPTRGIVTLAATHDRPVNVTDKAVEARAR
jgi:hypothetical protein